MQELRRHNVPSSALDGLGRTKSRYHLPVIVLLVLSLVVFLLWPGRPTPQNNIKYGLMFDAGSTGSRIHVYSFDATSGRLLGEIFQEVKPGLSAYKADPKQAALSLKPLMEIAVKNVPQKLHKCTPIALKATAGLRQLGKEQAEAILQAVRDYWQEFDFVQGPDAVRIMEGSDEGVYAWITVNYLLGKLSGSAKHNTVSIMDLGGASTQIVFEPKVANENWPASFKYALKFNGQQYVLYQNSYDRYGLMRARERLLSVNAQGSSDVSSPCIPSGFTDQITLDTKSLKIVSANPNWADCVAHATSILNKDKSCEVEPCSFNGVFQPSLADPATFDGDMYAFSYFYDRTQGDGPRPTMSLAEIAAMGKVSCSSEAKDATQGRQCADLSYIYALLSAGYNLKDSAQLQIAKKIDGFETAWTLGCMLVFMDGNQLTCPRP
eukprot:TRINITY_DN192_c0_g1_i4.p1 TRINITY_DN192_c0_g1~~TRINITY_DN192_c0_g1_i4.p1  ORF type:complete len:436 (-),score=59.41 TRINITY_DN192_c0_g1_i4:26-1333(-)